MPKDNKQLPTEELDNQELDNEELDDGLDEGASYGSSVKIDNDVTHLPGMLQKWYLDYARRTHTVRRTARRTAT